MLLWLNTARWRIGHPAIPAYIYSKSNQLCRNPTSCGAQLRPMRVTPVCKSRNSSPITALTRLPLGACGPSRCSDTGTPMVAKTMAVGRVTRLKINSIVARLIFLRGRYRPRGVRRFAACFVCFSFPFFLSLVSNLVC